MKLAVNQKTIVFAAVFALALFSFACSQPGAKTGGQGATGTPTEAYKKLYEGVKAKNVEITKSVMSKKTLQFAEGVAAQRKIPVDQVFENGFTATTFSPSLPEIRDERIKDGFGSVEVYNSNEKKWEDLPFVLEDGGWKLAIGDLFANTFTSPGKGRAVLEMEAANASGNSQMIMQNTNAAANFTSGKRPGAANSNSMPMPPAPPANASK